MTVQSDTSTITLPPGMINGTAQFIQKAAQLKRDIAAETYRIEEVERTLASVEARVRQSQDWPGKNAADRDAAYRSALEWDEQFDKARNALLSMMRHRAMLEADLYEATHMERLYVLVLESEGRTG